METVTLDSAIDVVVQLPQEQQEMLLGIMQNRHIEMRRKEIAADADASLAAFRAGELTPQSAEDVIAELHDSLTDGA